jgi:zinc transporter
MTAVTVRDTGLICAYLLDGKGGGKSLDWEEVRGWKQTKGVLWVHLDYRRKDSVAWLHERSGLDQVTIEQLLDDEPRPRAVAGDQGLMLIVRCVNLNEGAQPEDMVSMRIWIDSQRVITLRHRRNNAAKAVRRHVEEGRGPKRIGQFLVMMIDCILDPIGALANRLEDSVARLEDTVLSSENYLLRHELADARRRIIAVKRHVAPERDVLSRLHSERLTWLTEVDRMQLGEEANRMTRILEDLDSARDRAAVTQEEVASRLSEMSN